jgi:HD superfamily phosphohydrolase
LLIVFYRTLVITKRKKLGFTKVGISTIQKIIECRDSVYLWICNHHAVVYTDYVLHESIDHMGNLFQFSDKVENPPVYISVKRILSRIDDLMQYYDEYNMNEGTLKIKNSITSTL